MWTAVHHLRAFRRGPSLGGQAVGHKEPFDRSKLVAGMRAATKNRPVSDSALEELAQQVEDSLRGEGAEVASQRVGLAVLERLREVDEVAYLRFASFTRASRTSVTFNAKVGLLTKTTEPKRRG